MKGKGNLTLTGQLGEVMRESAQIATPMCDPRPADWASTRFILKRWMSMSMCLRVPPPKTDPLRAWPWSWPCPAFSAAGQSGAK